ncbi:hypothetical protein F2P81_008342 [Scophthalmus maximus]|uniref:Uncharacterized protein n=1 Tax=Scophthalmus maximus TaxID=52904 RepID=A0A6A4T212_SCOMX|nr:hypothetical protein F2P81_008342 [Scophthalmus maximus]
MILLLGDRVPGRDSLALQTAACQRRSLSEVFAAASRSVSSRGPAAECLRFRSLFPRRSWRLSAPRTGRLCCLSPKRSVQETVTDSCQTPPPPPLRPPPGITRAN